MCLHRWGSVSRPKILSNFGGKFLFLFCLCWLEIHRDLKLLSLFENYLKSSILFLEELLWERSSFKILLCVYSNLCKLSCKGILTKWFIKFSMPKECFTNIFQKLFL
jgi:hypothetical protein